MLVLGAALMATCVTFAVLTGGITAPLMIYGLATGAILLTGGVVACMAGRQKGIDKALSNYNHAANKPQHSPCLFASYQAQNERTESSNNILTIRP